MTEPWTPGPWWSDDFRVAHGRGEDMEDVVWEVATGPHGEANARLIALAPEMAELLAICNNKRLVEYTYQDDEYEATRCWACMNPIEWHETDCWVVAARALLARARGTANERVV